MLVVDMPPGTGDIQLTLVQRTALAGAVLVSTPQEAALIDVRRGAAMFAKTATPILGRGREHGLFPRPDHGRADPHLRPRRGQGDGRAARRALPGRGADRHGAAGSLRHGPADRRDGARTASRARPSSPSPNRWRRGWPLGDAGKPAPRIVFED